MAEIAILGAGVMGSAMAIPAVAGGHGVTLIGTPLDEAILRSVAGNGHHPGLGLALPETVRPRAWTAFGEVMAERPDLLILGVSSAGIDWAIERIVESVRSPLPVLMITKGLAPTGDGIDVLPVVLRRAVRARTGLDLPVMAVGGPCIAGELAATRHTRVVITGENEEILRQAVDWLGGPFYHAQSSDDVVGVEVCAAFKNFYALGVGWAAGRLESEGRGPNGAAMHNLASGLFGQSLAEMAILVEALGGRRETVAGLAGAGDLYVTCLAGRNSRMGRLLGLGHRFRAAKAEHMAADTIEGAELALALGPTLEHMMTAGRLPAAGLPLMAAILDAICRDAPMTIDWTAF